MSFTLESVDVPKVSDADIDLDETPDVDSPGYDAEAPYGRTKSGRIRKRPVGSATRVGTSTAKNERLATQATAAVMEAREAMTLGAMMFGLADTSSVLVARSDAFKARIHNAFLLDSQLAETVVKAGVKSGKIMFLSAILLDAAAVAPTAVVEIRALREAA